MDFLNRSINQYEYWADMYMYSFAKMQHFGFSSRNFKDIETCVDRLACWEKAIKRFKTKGGN